MLRFRSFSPVAAAAQAAVALFATTAAWGSSTNPKHFVNPNAVPVYGPNNYIETFDSGGVTTDYGTRDVTGSTNLWTVGAGFSTKQEWTQLDDNRVNDTSVATDPTTGFIHGAGSFTTPLLTVHGPGFVTASNNFYSFEDTYGADAVVANYGGTTGSLNGGTLLLMQTAAGLNPDYRPVYSVGDITAPAAINGGVLHLTKGDGSALPSSPQTLLFDTNFQLAKTPTSFGLLPYQELIWGIWVPSWTGDVKIDFGLPVHTMFSSMRVDTGVGAMNGTPSFANFTLGPPPTAATLYWDIDGTGTAGAGGTSPSGNWNGTTADFNSSSTGGSPGSMKEATSSADTVVFAAGTNATGSYTVTVSGTQSAAQVKIEEGNVTFTGGNLAVGAFDVAAGASGTVASTVSGGTTGGVVKSGTGTLTLTGTNSYSGGTTVQAGTLEVKKLHVNNAVTITGGKIKVVESSPNYASGHPAGDNAFVSRPSSLTIANNGAPLGSRVYSGALDLTNNDLIIDYTGASPILDIEDMVRAGFNGGDFLGNGITTSIGEIDNSFVLAVADNASLAAPFGIANGGALFSGVDVDLTSVLVKFTNRVDLNLDGVVTPADATIFGTNFDPGQPAIWATGDLDYDGVYTPNDATIFGTFYDPTLSSLPEPGSLAVICILGLSLVRRRRSA